MNHQTLDAYTLALLLILGIAVPLLGIWDFRRLIRWTEEGRPDARLKTYNWLLVMEWGLTLGLLGWYLAAGRDLADLKLVGSYHRWQWLAVGIGGGAAFFLLWQLKSVLGNGKELAKVREKIGDLMALVPRTPREHRSFAVVSVTAGVCEEILYRGFLMITLAPLLGTWQAVAVSSVIFGLGHVYQGFTGILKTTLVGLVMALFALFSGSLLVPIILHALIDLTSGRIMGAAAEAAPRD